MVVYVCRCERGGPEYHPEIELFPEGVKPGEWVVDGKPAVFLGSGFGAIIVAGNTYPLREKLKQLGFRWNSSSYKWVMEKNVNLMTIEEIAKELGKEATVYLIYKSDNPVRAADEEATLQYKDCYSIMRHFRLYFTEVREL